MIATTQVICFPRTGHQTREPVSSPIRSRLPAFAVALTLASVTAACSSSDSTSDTTASSAAPTTEAVATTPTPTSTTSVSSTDSTTVEEAIRAAHTRVMTELFARDERVTGPEAILPLAEELTTGPLLRRIQDGVKQRVESGERSVGPGYDSNIVRVTILSSDRAQVVDCSQDRGERFSADGALLVPGDDFFKLRTTELIQADGRWMVNELFVGGDERCDPAA